MKKEIIATDRNNEEGELPGESEVNLKARILACTQNMSTNKYCVVYCTVCETINTLSTEYSPAHQYFNTACVIIDTLNTKQPATDKTCRHTSWVNCILMQVMSPSPQKCF